MLLGILVTAAYGLVVVRRRLHLADDVDDYEKQVLGIEDEAPEAVPATGTHLPCKRQPRGALPPPLREGKERLR